MKKYVMLVAGICGILSGIFIIYASIVDMHIPKAIWLLLAICSFISAAYNFYIYRGSRDKGKK